MADWSFRYRVKLGERMQINSKEAEYYLTEPESQNPVVLRSWLGGPIDETRDIVLRGSGYPTAEEAEQAALRWRSALTIGFAAHNLSADFGQRAGQSYIDPAFRAAHATDEDPVVLHDLPELMIFETDPPPRFMGVHVGDVTVGKPADGLREAVRLAYRERTELTDREHLAFSTYTSSFGQKPDARLVTLISAVELLLDPQPRAPESLAVVEQLTARVEASDLPMSERDSMLGSLSWLRKQSISQAAKSTTAEPNWNAWSVTSSASRSSAESRSVPRRPSPVLIQPTTGMAIRRTSRSKPTETTW